MTAYSRSSNLAAYQTVAVHGGVAASDPHRLDADAAGWRDGAHRGRARRHGANGEPEARSRLLHRAVAIIDELRGSLNVERAANWPPTWPTSTTMPAASCCVPIWRARTELLDEVANLLREIRSAWIQIPADPDCLPEVSEL